MSSDRDQLLEIPAVRFGIGVGVLFVATTACLRLGAGLGTAEAGLAVLCLLGAVCLPLRFALPLGLVTWALVTGFLVNAGGQLTLAHHDLLRALTFGAIACAASLVAAPVGRGQRGTRTSSRPGTQVIRSSRPGPIESPSS